MGLGVLFFIIIVILLFSFVSRGRGEVDSRQYEDWKKRR